MRQRLDWTRVVVLCLLLAGCRLQAQQAPSSTSPNVSGTGTTNFIPIWTNSTTLGNSTLFEKSSKVGIGTTVPAATLEVNGTAKFDQGVTFASGQTFPGTAGLKANTFTGTQTISAGNVSISSGNLDLPQTTSATVGVINLGGSPFIHDCCELPDGYSNTYVGLFAGNFHTTSAEYSTGVGYQALSSNQGEDNTAVGYQALSATTGTNNTGVGHVALWSNTTGNDNTSEGAFALSKNTTGGDNTAAGQSALSSNSMGAGNSAVGSYSLSANTTGSSNTTVGDSSLALNATGSYNTALGASAGVGSGNLTNATAIGYCATVSASNALVLGTPAHACSGISADTYVGIDVGSPSNILTVVEGGGPAIADGWSTYSSSRWKSNIQPLHNALAKVERLRGVEYTYTANGKRDIGMIAEEVGKVVPEVVSYEDNGKDARGIDYARLTALLVEAVKQQQTEIRQQQAQISRLKSEVRALEASK